MTANTFETREDAFVSARRQAQAYKHRIRVWKCTPPDGGTCWFLTLGSNAYSDPDTSPELEGSVGYKS